MPDWLAPWIEWIGAAFGFACVVLVVRRSIWNWPIGLINVLLYIYVFAVAKLYSDMLLQVGYVFFQIYGWWIWASTKTHEGTITPLTLRSVDRAGWVAGSLLVTAGWGFLMARYTDASLPYWDAATTVLSIAAQILLAKKYIENWLFWIVVDVMCVGIYTYKGLHATAALYAVFLVLATLGFVVWNRNRKVLPPARSAAEPA